MTIALTEKERYMELCGALTPMELRVFKVIAEGITSNAQIAKRINIKSRTVEVHRMHIMRKLRIPSMTQMLLNVAEIIGLPEKEFIINTKKELCEIQR